MRCRTSTCAVAIPFAAIVLIVSAALPADSRAAFPSLERADWIWSSVPVNEMTPEGFTIPVSYFVTDHTLLEWYTPRPDGPTAAKEHDLNPLLTGGEGGNDNHPVLEWSVKTSTSEEFLDPEDWTGLTQAISLHGVDLSNSRFIEIWINDFTARHDSTAATLHLDLGRVSEDAFWSRTSPPNGRLDTEDKNFDGRLDLGTGPGDANFEDTGLDGMVSPMEPGYDSTLNPDPDGDDYWYDIVHDPDDYSMIDNFEMNGLGSTSARPETEDLNLNTILDTENAYFEATIDLSDTLYVVLDVPKDYVGHPNVDPENGWRLFRLPLSAEAFRSVGSPSLESVRHLRLWIGRMQRPVKFQIGGIQIDGFASPPAVDRVALYQNRPNPFNPATTIPYELAKDGPVRLVVFDIHGRLVRELVDAVEGVGKHYVTWDGVDRDGRSVASGVYVYRITVDGKQDARRMVLVK